MPSALLSSTDFRRRERGWRIGGKRIEERAEDVPRLVVDSGDKKPLTTPRFGLRSTALIALALMAPQLGLGGKKMRRKSDEEDIPSSWGLIS